MKINLKHVTISFFFGIFLIQSCEKPFDYRNKYIGKWKFSNSYSIHYTRVIAGQIPYDTSYITIYDGEIKYGAKFDEILLQFTPSYDLSLQLDKYGVVVPKEFTVSYPYSYSGKFDRNNRFYYTSYSSSIMQFHSSTMTIYGEKK